MLTVPCELPTPSHILFLSQPTALISHVLLSLVELSWCFPFFSNSSPHMHPPTVHLKLGCGKGSKVVQCCFHFCLQIQLPMFVLMARVGNYVQGEGEEEGLL